MKEKSKALVYKSSLQFKSSLALKEEILSKVKVMLEKERKIAAKSSSFGGATHWVRGTVHREGAADWAALHSVKNTLARHI